MSAGGVVEETKARRGKSKSRRQEQVEERREQRRDRQNYVEMDESLHLLSSAMPLSQREKNKRQSVEAITHGVLEITECDGRASIDDADRRSSAISVSLDDLQQIAGISYLEEGAWG